MPENLGAVGGTPAAAGAGGTGDAVAGATGGGDGGGVATEIDPNAGGTGDGGEGGDQGDGSEAAGGEGEGAEGGEGGDGEGGEGKDEGEQGEESDGSEFETDGRKIDDATKKALAALKKVNPEAAKRAAESYFKHQAYQKVFPTVHEARGAKATIQALGGQEGIKNLQTKVSDYDSEITQFANGDPQLVTKLWQADPKGVELSTAASIELIAKSDAEMFDRVISGPMVARLEKAGLYQSLGALAEHIKAGDGDKAYALLQNISKWFDGAKTMSEKQLELKSKADPEREALTREKQEFEQQKVKEFEKKIATNANTLQNTAMSKVVDPFFKDIKMPNEGRREFVQNLQRKVWAAMKADDAFQMQARAVQKEGDAQATAEFIAEKFEELLPGIFRTYRNSLYPNYARMGTKPANGAGAVAGGKGAAPGAKPPINVAAGARPKHTDVDWTKTSTTDWILGKATLVNGKRITFDKNAPPNKI
jgi:hypothetical protein